MPRRFSIYAEFKDGASRASVDLASYRRRALSIATRWSTDSATADYWRASCQASRRHSRKLLRSPVAQASTQELRLDSQSFADRLE